ncbi:phage tail assembly protein [Pseudomonas putida]|uniref:phage tail assembly protein n=1 Tax=Pseudomonas putida TaxID=303 RepID=UPI00117A3023|nr:phage tail assembly protein [Pseudomonas putida]TRO33870.1 phage tail assembly protein [Pseudomonas putida]
MKEVIELAVPIQAHGVEVTKLELRRPTVTEVRKIRALPYKFDKDEALSLDMDVAAQYIAVCGHIPPSSVNQMDLADLGKAAWAVAGFFMKPASATLTA